MRTFSDERKTKAQEFLQRIKSIENKIRRLLAEKRRWFELATNIASKSSDEVRVRSSGNKEKMANDIIKGLADDVNIDIRIEKLKAERQEIIDVIESIPEPYCEILYKVYVEYEPLKEVSFTVKESYNETSKKHRVALMMVYEIIECKKCYRM